jgi:hypothetical protein
MMELDLLEWDGLACHRVDLIPNKKKSINEFIEYE